MSQSNAMSESNDDYFKSFPPGYRFCPTDDELVTHYLMKKILDQPLPRNKIVDVDLYSSHPQRLADRYEKCGENEWYFFTSRVKKYPNGNRPKRSVGGGYWKVAGAKTLIKYKRKVIGSKHPLAFYLGESPKGTKTNWIMHEFKAANVPQRNTDDNSMKLDDWVLCRIYKRVSTEDPSEENIQAVSSSASPTQPDVDMGAQDSTYTTLHQGENIQPIVNMAVRNSTYTTPFILPPNDTHVCPSPDQIIAQNPTNPIPALTPNSINALYSNSTTLDVHDYEVLQLPIYGASFPNAPYNEPNSLSILGEMNTQNSIHTANPSNALYGNLDAVPLDGMSAQFPNYTTSVNNHLPLDNNWFDSLGMAWQPSVEANTAQPLNENPFPLWK